MKGLPEILSLLERHNIKATFFVSGNVAEQFKDILIEVKNKGNEVASHGYDHVDYSKLNANEIEYQLKKSKDVLESTLNKKVFGFRIPQFRQNAFLYSSLNNVGYRYDSSIVSGARLKGRYDFSSCPNTPFMKDGILEVPVSTIPGLSLPFGLLWVNAMGSSIYKLLYNLSNNSELQVCYLHPFDILQRKNANDFGILIKGWYHFRSRKVIETLEKLLQFWRQNNKVTFPTIEQLLDE